MDHKKLREIRTKKEWTQGFAAKQIGIQQSYLSKLENGQAIPSNEIIESIAKAYDIDRNLFAADLVPEFPQTESKPVHRTPFISIALLLIGLIFIGLAWFGIYKSNYAYTYELVIEDQEVISAPVYFILDEYQGEKFQKEFSEIKYTYQLIGERKINPKQNRWFYYFGFILLGIALVNYGLSTGRFKKSN